MVPRLGNEPTNFSKNEFVRRDLVKIKYDTMSRDDLKHEADLIPNARFAFCENGSHLCMYDDQETYFRHVISFIRDNDRGVKMK